MSSFEIKNEGFEHTVIFEAMLMRKLEPYILKKIPFQAVIKYDPKRDCNVLVRIIDANMDEQNNRPE